MFSTKRVLFPLAISLVPVLASAAGCDWVDKVDHVAVNPDAGDGSTPSGPAAARFRLASGATTPPNLFDVPFPSDAYLGANGRIVDPLPGLASYIPSPAGAQALAHDLAVMNGFSRIAMSIFYVDDPANVKDGEPAAADIDKASLPATENACKADTSAVFLVDLDATDAALARIGCRAQFHTNTRTGSRSALAVGPARGIVLKEGHKYATVLTNRVKLASGQPLAASPDFDRIRKGDRNGALASLYGQAIDKATSALGSALSGAEIVALAPFTTNKMSDELFTLREAIGTDDATAPDLKWDEESVKPMKNAKFAGTGTAIPTGFTDTIDAYLGYVATGTPRQTVGEGPAKMDNPSTHLPIRAHDRIASIGTAVFESTSFLRKKEGGYRTIDHATFARTTDGKNDLDVGQHTPDKIWVTFTVPTRPPASDAGYPVVILQHGLGGSRDYIFALANTLALAGYVTAAIDSVTFGARTGAGKTDATTDYINAKNSDPAKNNDSTYGGGDGIGDTRNGATDLFGSLINIGALRDQMRQAALDTTQLVRVLRKESNRVLAPLQFPPTDPPDPAKAPKIDSSKIAYIGNSLGGIQGATAAAIEPNIREWVLNVAGGGLITELATHSPRISASLESAAGANFGIIGDKLSEFHPLVTLLQTVAEPGDPLAYADLLITAPRKVGNVQVTPRNILQIEVIYDELVPNEANEALARAGGWRLGTPNVGSNAGVTDVKTLAGRDTKLLADVSPDADGFIQNTPANGTTAVLLQVSPSQHGSDLESAGTLRVFAAPYARFNDLQPFPLAPAGEKGYQIVLGAQYLQLQTMAISFISQGLAGQVPKINVKPPTLTNPTVGFTPPVRNVDGDSAPDETDADPNDPKKQ
ncbi:hypothetical protein LVJ94_14400 [Pendulispora rubella]|uniref:Lipase n=1 Tax=Pendulispora rubella TaxID=2741070 RepID=A0ABZ2LBW2_9BACT